MYILGINAYHGDASACIIKDGQLIAADEEELFNRIKDWAGFPVWEIAHTWDEAIRCLSRTKADTLAIGDFLVLG